ncbi:hypothetical protein ACRAWD_06595 [Caulobacter segnis]
MYFSRRGRGLHAWVAEHFPEAAAIHPGRSPCRPGAAPPAAGRCQAEASSAVALRLGISFLQQLQAASAGPTGSAPRSLHGLSLALDLPVARFFEAPGETPDNPGDARGREPGRRDGRRPEGPGPGRRPS